MLNETEYLLGKLAEEAGEVTQRAMKALRFGLNERQPGQQADNEARLVDEIVDLLAVVDMLHEAKLIDMNRQDEHVLEQRKARVREFMEYSRTQGCLEPAFPEAREVEPQD